MRAIDRLKRDHKILRSKLDVLEAALRMGPASTWYILREMCYTLSRQLQDHIRREEELVAACRKALSLEVLRHVQIEHHDEPQILRSINHLFVEEQDRVMEQATADLRLLIPRLRRHMAEEEAELFPAIEQILADQGEAEQQTCGPPGLREDRTVNAVIHAYPQTKAVFDRYFINVLFEGYDCLDEVAWRRGISCQELLTRLEEAMASEKALELKEGGA